MNFNNLYLLTYDYEEAFKIKQDLESIGSGNGRVHFDVERGFYTVPLINVEKNLEALKSYISNNNYRLVRGYN